IIPIRCFSCGKVVGNAWEQYLIVLQTGISEGSALTGLNVRTKNQITQGSLFSSPLGTRWMHSD
ncbi:hypothetical protein PSHT_12233, partial [Puccinia striiformis]